MTAAAAAPLPEGAAAVSPPEARGIARDGVRMLVASATEGLRGAVVRQLPAVLRPGDLVVLNTSDTLPAALRGITADGEPVELHLSTVEPGRGTTAGALRGTRSRWVVELRRPSGRPGGEPLTVDRTGTEVTLSGAHLTVDAPYAPGNRRLWTAELRTPAPLGDFLAGHGEPVRYGYTAAPWPLSAYRTDHADTPGSAEMPSAGRPVTTRVLRNLRRRGVGVATVVLHCGLSSPDKDEPPYAEWYSVPPSTMAAVRGATRVIAIGTTVVRALESAARTGRAEGWTDLVIGPGQELSTVDGLLTGWHPPEASHLQMLAAVADPDLLTASYAAAAAEGYLWHEFGDVHLILP
ncbi:MAG TPA: S-adenosylmethionine:tRNA ribosyltransferase-isomerase [Mycobacteriales bacterium]